MEYREAEWTRTETGPCLATLPLIAAWHSLFLLHGLYETFFLVQMVLLSKYKVYLEQKNLKPNKFSQETFWQCVLSSSKVEALCDNLNSWRKGHGRKNIVWNVMMAFTYLLKGQCCSSSFDITHSWSITANHSLIVLKILDLFIPISTKFLWAQSKRKVV